MKRLMCGAAVGGLVAAGVLVGAGTAAADVITTGAGGAGTITVTTSADWRQVNCSAWTYLPNTGQWLSKAYTVNPGQTGSATFSDVPAGTYRVDWSCSSPDGGPTIKDGGTNVTVTQPGIIDMILKALGS